jgi:phospholipid transport system substrate-binding protein
MTMTGFARTAVAAFVALFLVTPLAAEAGCPAEGFVRSAGNAMMGAARRKSPDAFAGVASRYTDLNAIALFALGPHRSRLQRSREAEYLSLTRTFIGRFMAKHADRFDGTSLSVASCNGTTQAFTVNATLSDGQKLVFRLNRTRNGYKVRDLNVSSIWLAQQLRSTFVSVLQRNNGNVDALFRYLRTYS